MSTALAILKGALSLLLNFPLGRTTVAVNIPEPGVGRLTVVTNSVECPSNSMMRKLAEIVIKIIKEDRLCYSFRMGREEAESLYGEIIYDKYEVTLK